MVLNVKKFKFGRMKLLYNLRQKKKIVCFRLPNHVYFFFYPWHLLFFKGFLGDTQDFQFWHIVSLSFPYKNFEKKKSYLLSLFWNAMYPETRTFFSGQTMMKKFSLHLYFECTHIFCILIQAIVVLK